MENPYFKERRKYPRFPIKLLLKYYHQNNNPERDDQAQTKDICAEGLGLVTNEQLAADTVLDIWLQIPDDNEQIHTKGKVVWSKTLEPKHSRAGVSLENTVLNPVSLALKTIQAHIRDRHKT